MASLLDFARRVITGFSMWVQLHGPACRQGAYIMSLPLRREAGGLVAIITTHIPEGRDAGLWTIVLYISQLNTLLKRYGTSFCGLLLSLFYMGTLLGNGPLNWGQGAS